MTDEKILPNNMLTAEELLQNKGIKSIVWDEFEKSSQILPRMGKKQFEPNGLWLQNMQIEKGINNCKDLIATERVERISQLAIAEWIAAEKRARVIKNSGQDWNSFGLEKNSTLYLIPEEALFLLEANCLELLWNNVPLSIQQAYELLIDNIECSMAEYRVYSQLVRCGYRIQRYIYEHSEWSIKNDETKRKDIFDPQTGLRLTDGQQKLESSEIINNDQLPKCSRESPEVNDIDPDVKVCQEVKREMVEFPVVDDEVQKIAEGLLDAVERLENNCASADQENLYSNSEIMKLDNDKTKRNKVEIISDKTLFHNIKIVRQCDDDSSKCNPAKRLQGARIQRNVKLLPKRTDKPQPVEITLIDANNGKSDHLEKRRKSSLSDDDLRKKKTKLEVIELSDDEIEQLPPPMTKKELLNLIPNVAHQFVITAPIAKQYIPRNIKPQKSVYQYDYKTLRNFAQEDKRSRNAQCKYQKLNRNSSQFENTSSNAVVRGNMNALQVSQNSSRNTYNVPQASFFSTGRGHHTSFGSYYNYTNRFPLSYNHNSYWYQRNSIIGPNMFRNTFNIFPVHNNMILQNRFVSIQMNNFGYANMPQYGARNSYMRNRGRNSFQNFSTQRRYRQNMDADDMPMHKSALSRSKNQGYNNRNGYQCSFKTLPAVSTWAELKTKWREEKTITIDDEDCVDNDIADSSEVQVVEQCNPLIGPKNAKTLAEIFERLRIIKTAPEKTVRRKKSRYKISYNVYSNTQHYRKANPGVPLYRIVVISQSDDTFIQPVEIHRLQQDSKNSPIVLACVSMSISYMQPGYISVPQLN